MVKEVQKRKPAYWTEQELRILYEVYPRYGAKGCIERGLNRSISAINAKAIAESKKGCQR